MFKFFRKIRKNLLSENRITRYLIYALGEIFLVMVGILLALQVNNWNENRKQANEENGILLRLLNDFTQNDSLIADAIKEQEFVTFRARKLLEAVDNYPQLVQEDSLVLYIDALPYIPKFTPVQGTLTSIISSGQITLISNGQLNVLLTKWPGIYNGYVYEQKLIQDQSNDWDEFSKGIYPFRATQVDVGFGSSGSSNFTFDQKLLLSSLELENIAEFKRVSSEFTTTKLYTLREIISEISKLLNQEIIKL